MPREQAIRDVGWAQSTVSSFVCLHLLESAPITIAAFGGRTMFAGSYPAPRRDSCPRLRRGSAAQNSRSPGAIGPCGGLDDRHRYFPNVARHPVRSLCAHQRKASRLPFDPNCRMESAIRRSSGSVPSWPASLQAAIQKCLRRASCAIGALGIGRQNSYGTNKEISQRRVHSVSDQPLDTGRIVTLPLRVGRQRNVCRPSRNRAGRNDDRVAYGLISATAPIEHSRQQRHVEVGIVIDPDLALSVIQAMQATGILGNCPTPRHWQRKKQRIQPGIIKPLSDISAGRQQYSLFIIRECSPVGR